MSYCSLFVCLLFIFFFFLMLLLPPSSSLFPYTTLFRSLLMTAPDPKSAAKPANEFPYSVMVTDVYDGPLDLLLDLIRKQKDRKSTRLNSSHRCISYAVFCLKKKNKKKNI